MTEIRTYEDHGINWIWYLKAEFNDETGMCRIIFHDRWHKYDDKNHPEVTSKEHFEIDRGNGRDVKGVKVAGRYYIATS